MSKYSNKKNAKIDLKNDALKLLRDSDLTGNLRLNLLTKINSDNQNSIKSAIATLKTTSSISTDKPITMSAVKAHKTIISKAKEVTRADDFYNNIFKDVTQFNKVF